MKLFSCDNCGNTLYFDNTRCERCGHRLGYLPQANKMVSLVEGSARWTSLSQPDQAYVFCANAQHDACNWLIPASRDGDIYCTACRHNQIIPPIGDPANLNRWRILERAKKRLVYSLLRLELPLQTRVENPRHGLSFRFLADMPIARQQIITGHESGIITIALAEADDPERERRRAAMSEPYRTLLGHFRHEIGHHYWDLLVDGHAPHRRFRELFGDETVDYQLSLQRYYSNGAPPDWQSRFISAYSSAHPWEDFAETFAHYLHITDTLETAGSFGLSTHPRLDEDSLALLPIAFDPYDAPSVGKLIESWIPLASLLNNLNRSVGQPDAYPFILTMAVIEKLSFINDLIGDAARSGAVEQHSDAR